MGDVWGFRLEGLGFKAFEYGLKSLGVDIGAHSKPITIPKNFSPDASDIMQL